VVEKFRERKKWEGRGRKGGRRRGGAEKKVKRKRKFQTSFSSLDNC